MKGRNGRPVIFGEVLFDIFSDGSTVLGGAPFNVAWHLQAWGLAPLFISRVGDDSLGRNIRRAMQNWGLDTAGLQMDSIHPTGTVKVKLDNGEPVFEIVDNRAYDHIQPDTISSLDPALLYHGTLAVRNRTSAQALARLKQAMQVPVFLDVNLRPPWWRLDKLDMLLRDANQVKLNQDELDTLVDGAGRTPDAKAQLLQSRYDLEQVIVTLGRNGAIARNYSGAVYTPAPEAGSIQVVDTVGAGDAFTSVALLGFMLGWPLQRTMDRAQQFASAIVSVRGAVIGEQEFYHPFIQRWELPQK